MSSPLTEWAGHCLEYFARDDHAATLGKLKDVLAADVRRCFETQSSPDGQPWAAPKRPTGQTLEQGSGALLAGAVAAAENPQIGPRTMTVVIDSPPYARFQQDGTEHDPARPFLGFSDAVLDRAADLLADEAVRALTT